MSSARLDLIRNRFDARFVRVGTRELFGETLPDVLMRIVLGYAREFELRHASHVAIAWRYGVRFDTRKRSVMQAALRAGDGALVTCLHALGFDVSECDALRAAHAGHSDLLVHMIRYELLPAAFYAPFETPAHNAQLTMSVVHEMVRGALRAPLRAYTARVARSIIPQANLKTLCGYLCGLIHETLCVRHVDTRAHARALRAVDEYMHAVDIDCVPATRVCVRDEVQAQLAHALMNYLRRCGENACERDAAVTDEYVQRLPDVSGLLRAHDTATRKIQHERTCVKKCTTDRVSACFVERWLHACACDTRATELITRWFQTKREF